MEQLGLKLFIGLMAGGGVLYLIALFIDLEIRLNDYNGEKVKNRKKKIKAMDILVIISAVLILGGYILLFTLR
jgi:hypothetical protein